jgi:hypothetical protein
MPICDVCNADAEGVTVPYREFQRAALEGGFDPFMLGLCAGRAEWSRAQNLDYWNRLVRENQTDWFLCHDCHRALPVRGHSAREPAPSRAAIGSADLPSTLEELRRRHPLPPQPGVPADWKPGFFRGLFGTPKPWGALEEAVALLRHGRIAEARELFRRHRAQSDDLAARLWLAFESRRPPTDPAIKASELVPGLPQPERAAVEALIAFSQLDGQWLGDSMLAAMAAAANSELGAFLQLAAFVAGSDLWMQTQLLHPRGRTVASMFVVKPVKALALMLERRHDEAWALASEGAADPGFAADSYARNLALQPTAAEAATVNDAARDYCAIVLGLILFELGHDAARRAHFARLAQHCTGHVATACRQLA